MKKRIFNIILVFFLCSVLDGLARGEIITIEVTGIVNSIGESGFNTDGSVSIGSVMTGFCTYDIETPDLVDSEYVGEYELLSLSMTIGNYTFTHDTLSSEYPFFRVGVVDPTFWAYSPEAMFDGTVYLDGVPREYDDIFWKNREVVLLDLWTSSSEFIPDDSLPTSLPDISVFDMRNSFGLVFRDYDGHLFGVSGEITSWNLIPEPATILLFGLGSLIFTVKRQNQTKAN
ncbi:MAG: PEP-CTERM sorting domain-containing protein [Sedimentisphaerales bacterium]|nr:PEP-CTERM sorting domain-containing protein [Sedimentisphaerales bacterium]